MKAIFWVIAIGAAIWYFLSKTTIPTSNAQAVPASGASGGFLSDIFGGSGSPSAPAGTMQARVVSMPSNSGPSSPLTINPTVPTSAGTTASIRQPTVQYFSSPAQPSAPVQTPTQNQAPIGRVTSFYGYRVLA